MCAMYMGYKLRNLVYRMQTTKFWLGKAGYGKHHEKIIVENNVQKRCYKNSLRNMIYGMCIAEYKLRDVGYRMWV